MFPVQEDYAPTVYTTRTRVRETTVPKKPSKQAPLAFLRQTPPPRAVAELVQAIGAIDVGSNAMRLVVATVSRSGEMRVVDPCREAVRLGKDAFTTGLLREETIERALAAFARFKAKLDEHGVRQVRAVGTSALREAHNRDVFVDRVARETGIELEVIGGEEEARLVALAVSRAVNLRGKLALLIDIGGGSVEVTLVDDGSIAATESFRMGTVRLIERFSRAVDEATFQQQVREYIDLSKQWLRSQLGERRIDLCLATGGNCEALADLAVALDGTGAASAAPRTSLSLEHLDALCAHLLPASYEERMTRFGLRPDRADVIVPAALVLQNLLRHAQVSVLQVPRVGLKDGLLADMASEVVDRKRGIHRDQVVASAMQLGRRYRFDELHGRTVARLALSIFDQTERHHHLGEEERMLLEVAALLHDMGQFVNNSGHHKHTQYLLTSSRMIGLSEVQRGIIGNVARYHRKSPPTLRHEPYRLLQPRDRLVVQKLVAILRLADALDAEHGGKVSEVSVDLKRPRMRLRLRGEGDLLLEKWAVGRKASLFEEIYGVEIVVD